MATGPKGDKLIEAIVLELRDGAGDIVGTVSGWPLNDNLNRILGTFLMSVSFLMYEYLLGSSLRTREESKFS